MSTEDMVFKVLESGDNEDYSESDLEFAHKCLMTAVKMRTTERN